MHADSELNLRRLLLTVTTFSTVAALISLYGVTMFYDFQPLMIKSVSLYLIFYLVASGIGFIAAVKRNGTLLSFYAIHLLIDSIVLLVPRLLLARFSATMPQMICSNELPQTNQDHLEGNLDYMSAAIRTRNSATKLLSSTWSEESCQVWMWTAVLGLMAMMLIYTTAQVYLAVRLSVYAIWLGREKKLERLLARDFSDLNAVTEKRRWP